MSPKNEMLVRRFFEEVDAGNLGSARELVAPDYRDNLPGRAAPATFDELLEVIKAWRQGFPDLSHHLDEVFSKDDKVVVRGSTSPTFPRLALASKAGAVFVGPGRRFVLT